MVKILSSDYMAYRTRELIKNTDGSKLARKLIRGMIKKDKEKRARGNVSEFAHLPSRRERREAARQNKVKFEPQLNK